MNSFLWLIRFSQTQPTSSVSPRLDLSFLFNLVITDVLHLWSLLLAHLPAPLWKSPIAPLGMLHLVYGINSPLISASLVRHNLLLSCSFSYHTWQFIIFTFSTITACIIYYSLRISFWTQDLALQQILSSIDLFLFYRTDYTDSRTMLNGCTGKCVRLSPPLVGFWTHFKSPHFHFISPGSITWYRSKGGYLATGENRHIYPCVGGRQNLCDTRAVSDFSLLSCVTACCVLCGWALWLNWY